MAGTGVPRSAPRDRLRDLPEDILILVLSRLGMKEAARTSVLSRRWKNLWKFYTGRFDFDSLLMRLLVRYGEGCHTAPRYVNWVNQVLDSHQGYTIEELRISYNLDKENESFIDRWIDFAISRDVRRLELDLSPTLTCLPILDPDDTLPCSFPTWLLSPPLGFSNIKALTSLRLRSVDLTEETLNYFLSNCPMLEHLCVDYAPSLRNLTIGNTDKLKHLEITSCVGLKKLHIASAPNLVFFKYWGPEIDMVIKDVPRLSSLSLGGPCSMPLFFPPHEDEIDMPFPFPLSRLEELIWELPLMVEKDYFDRLPEFTEIRKLELKFCGSYSEHSILGLSFLVHACPRLEKLVLNYEFFRARRETHASGMFKGISEQVISRSKHDCLKEVEFYGWVGLKADFELATYLIDTATSLEKIVITPLHPDDPWRWSSRMPDKEQKAARDRARHLMPSSRTKLIIF